MSDVPPGHESLVGECSHSKSLSYGAFAMLLVFWGAKVPSVESTVPHIGEITNTVAVSFSGMVGWQAIRQARIGLGLWWSRHVEITGRATLSLGKRPRDGDSHHSDSS
jgi:hypothetical protein